MRTTVILCDRCGKEIAGNPVKIIAECVDRENADLGPDNGEKFPEGAEGLSDKDFCENCAGKIVRCALGGMKENPEFKKAVEEMVEGVSQLNDNRGKDGI
ncbi:MAG: hypothetical protein HDR23_06930 [Lachnospiraceae bacterium]|nr:hypothetical protein [Lachnospiraceae bacterium]